MPKINLTEKEKLMLDYEITNISITVHEPSGDVVSPLILRLADNRKFYLDKNQNRVELCGDIYDVNTGGAPDELGGSCANAMQTKDCDRDALIAKLQAILEAVDDLEVNTENINLNAEQINLNTDEVEQLLKDIKLLLEGDVTGDDCTTPMHIQDCDRQALLDKLDEVATLITDNATANKDAIISKLDDLKLLFTDIFDVLDLIEQHTKTSNDNEALIITELETANDTLQSILDEKNQSLVYSGNDLVCADNAGVKTTFITRTKFIWDNETGALVSETKEFSSDASTWTTTVPTGTLSLGQCVASAACKENKTYQIKGIKTITFDPNKIYGYKAGVWNASNPMTPLTGKASLEEGAGVVAEYGFGDSFGNGDEINLMPNAIIIKGLDADADVRISVIQECGYTPTIV
jgi:hypothetical protein